MTEPTPEQRCREQAEQLRRQLHPVLSGIGVLDAIEAALLAAEQRGRQEWTKEVQDANHDTLCHLTSLLLDGRGCWTKEELVAAVIRLRDGVAAARQEGAAAEREWCLSVAKNVECHTPEGDQAKEWILAAIGEAP